jgi:hypothetical protein
MPFGEESCDQSNFLRFICRFPSFPPGRSQQPLVQYGQIASANLVALYKALGGGWEIE